MALLDQVKASARQHFDAIVAIRRYLHQHPELSFEEYETAAFVQKQLAPLGVDVQTGVAGTGIVVLIKGRNPESRTVALRGDMDALPIQEQSTQPYKSQHDGKMHACGHDVHTSALLGAVHILAGLRDQFEGTVKCLFQPGEERVPGGASLMIKDHALENPKPGGIVAQHVFPELEVGKVGFFSGPYMASADELYVTVKGRGGHAALPQRLVDPVLISAHLIVALQQLVSRQANPHIPTVLSFGKVEAQGATNVIPGEVKLEGTLRTYDEAWRNTAHESMVKLATNLAESMGGSCDFEVRRGYPFLVNDPALTARSRSAAEAYLGKANVVDLEKRMTSEDFAFYSHHVPACFYRLGIRNEARGITSGLHTPTFDVDEAALETGMGLLAWIALSELNA